VGDAATALVLTVERFAVVAPAEPPRRRQLAPPLFY